MFRLQDDFYYTMPVHFGGSKLDPSWKATQKVTDLTISYETDRAQLENYIPEEFELLTPEVYVEFTKLTEINWLANGQYNLIQVAAPVRFNGKRDQLDGVYPLVLWENMTAPILTGREQTGIPKIYADIEDLRVVKPWYTTTISYEGSTFLTMNFEATTPITGKELVSMNAQMALRNTIGWRYIPKLGLRGAELSQFILFPQGMEAETALVGNGSLKWTEQTWMQNPTQYQIINSLASLPMKKVTQAVLIEGQATLYTPDARVLE